MFQRILCWIYVNLYDLSMQYFLLVNKAYMMYVGILRLFPFPFLHVTTVYKVHVRATVFQELHCCFDSHSINRQMSYISFYAEYTHSVIVVHHTTILSIGLTFFSECKSIAFTSAPLCIYILYLYKLSVLYSDPEICVFTEVKVHSYLSILPLHTAILGVCIQHRPCSTA